VVCLLRDGLGSVAVLRRERMRMPERRSDKGEMTLIGGVSAALANHGGVREPNRLAVSLPAATVSEVN